MPNKYMLLWLEAPLQSWGAESKFGRRMTLDFPTKSGVMGIICSALGAGGEQIDFLEKFSDLSQFVSSYKKRIPSRTGGEDTKLDTNQLRDFHMVGSGYDRTDLWEKLHIPRTSEGGIGVGKPYGGTKITHRYYLQDSYFSVIVEIPRYMEVELDKAMNCPVWDISLGRKSCIPTDFVYRGIFDSNEKAKSAVQQIVGDKSLVESFSVFSGEHEDGDAFTIKDVPVRFGKKKLYKDRQVTVVQVV